MDEKSRFKRLFESSVYGMNRSGNPGLTATGPGQ
jgi:hypothetical protein